MDGVLVIDKPAGPTSHDVVARVRGAIGSERIGHTGTLDPLATGVLPLVLGRATRLARFLTAADKEYEARIRLGVATDTYDAAGEAVDLESPAGAPPHGGALNQELVEQALGQFRGASLQQPPPFSAKKIAGVRAYELARRLTPVHPSPVPVVVHDLVIVAHEHDVVTLRIVCSAGFYVRSLAHDLGRTLGTGGCLESLTRRRSGDFRLDAAIPLERVEASPPEALGHLVPMHELLGGLPAFVLTGEGLRRVSHGSDVGPAHLLLAPGAADRGPVRLLDSANRLTAIAEIAGDGAVLHPFVVLV